MMALSPPSPTQSIFKKKSYSSASSLLSAVSEADTRRTRSHDKTPFSTPALSRSSGVSESSQDSILEDEFDPADGLAHPRQPPSSNQVYSTVHTEFGHCSNEEYRYKSEHNYNDPPESDFGDPPYYILISVYITFLLLICISHMRDFFGKRFKPLAYRHLVAHDVSCSTKFPMLILILFGCRVMHLLILISTPSILADSKGELTIASLNL